jgi:CheY-like chemotaxis protein
MRSPAAPCGPVAIGEVLKLIRSTLPATIEIRHSIGSRALVMGNTTQMHQILMNLCTNAAHAMEKDAGVLTLTVADTSIRRSDAPGLPEVTPGHYVEITVSDTGCGMSPETIEALFDPYFTTKEQGKGTGLGLSVVHGIVESYGGAIRVESTPGEGSTFRVYLPATRLRRSGEEPETTNAPTGTEHILLVDDEPPILQMGSRMLEGLGYTVTTTRNGIEALHLFQAHPDRFDLVITDLAMPRMNGDKLASQIAAIRPAIPILLCTGYSDHISPEQFEQIGIRGVAYKPIVRAELAATVRTVLDEAATPRGKPPALLRVRRRPLK